MDRLLPDGTAVNKDSTRIKRFKFSAEDDAKLTAIVRSSPRPINWRKVSQRMGTRSPRQCRERYKNHIAATIEDPEWTQEEDSLLLSRVALYGKRWGRIASELPRHSDICIKSHWRLLISEEKSKAFELKTPKNQTHTEVSSKDGFNSFFDICDNTFDSIFDRIFAVPAAEVIRALGDDYCY